MFCVNDDCREHNELLYLFQEIVFNITQRLEKEGVFFLNLQSLLVMIVFPFAASADDN